MRVRFLRGLSNSNRSPSKRRAFLRIRRAQEHAKAPTSARRDASHPLSSIQKRRVARRAKSAKGRAPIIAAAWRYRAVNEVWGCRVVGKMTMEMFSPIPTGDLVKSADKHSASIVAPSSVTLENLPVARSVQMLIARI